MTVLVPVACGLQMFCQFYGSLPPPPPPSSHFSAQPSALEKEGGVHGTESHA